MKEGNLYYTLHGHKGPTTAAQFSPDHQFFATTGADAQILVWNAHFINETNGEGKSETKSFPLNEIKQEPKEVKPDMIKNTFQQKVAKEPIIMGEPILPGKVTIC